MTDVAPGRTVAQTVLARATLFFVYLLPLAALVYWRPMMYFFEESKGFYVVGIADLLLLLLALRAAVFGITIPRTGRIGWTLITLVGVLFLASLLGIDFAYSFWGDATRVTGLFYWVHLIILFFTLTTVLRTKQQWHRFLFFCVCIALVVAVFQMLHLLDIYTIPGSRGGAMIGTSNDLSLYLLFHLFFALFLAVSKTSHKQKLFGFISAAFLGGILVAPNEAHTAIIVLFGSLLLLLTLSLIMVGQEKWKRSIGWTLLAIMIASSISSTFMLANPQSRLRSYMEDVSSGSRFILWDIAWQGIKERPLLGWGLELYPAVLFSYYNPCLGSNPCGGERYFDRAHNKLLDVWVESGIVGVLAYAGVFVAGVQTLWRLRRQRDDALPAAVLLALLGGYAVYLLINLDIAITLLFFVITLALIQSLSPQPLRTLAPPVRLRRSILVAAPCLFAIAIFFFVIQPVRASHAAERHKAATSEQEERYWYEVAERASPYGRRLRNTHIAFDVLVWLNMQGLSATASNPEFVLEATRRAQRTIEQQIARTDFDPRLYSLLGSLYQMEGRFVDPQGYERAGHLLQEGMAKYPINPMPHWAMVSVLLELGEFQQAQELTEAISLRSPDDPEVLYNQTIVETFTTGAAPLNPQEKYELLNLAGRF